MNTKTFDVIIIGGSYSGLSAAMTLARALMNVLIIDNGKPCNRQTPYSHNFLTQDGMPPAEINHLAKEQVEKYNTVSFFQGLAVSGRRISDDFFEIQESNGDLFRARQLIFATGVKDIMLDIPGFAECWGISVLHCPYCHGYEVRNQPTGILGNGAIAFEMAILISNWTNDLIIFTNGISLFTEEQERKLSEHHIKIEERKIEKLEHSYGQLQHILLEDGVPIPIKAIYHRPSFEQHCHIPESLGCELTEDGYLKTDPFQVTTVAGIYACGDNTSRMRTVSNAVAMGTTAGISASKKIIMQ